MFNIRRALKSDASEIARIHSTAWNVAYKGIIHDDVLKKMNYENRLQYFSNVLDTDQEETWVAEEGNSIVGFLTIGKTRDEDLFENDSEIWGMYIDINQWNRGIGSLLLKFAEEEFRTRSFDRTFLWTLKDNKKTRSFYEKNGFFTDGSKKVLKMIDDVVIVRYFKDI